MVSSDVSQDMYLRYNESFWPGHLLVVCLNFFIVFSICRYKKVLWPLVSLFWVFQGLYFFPLYFNELNIAGKYFQVIFILQGLLLLIKNGEIPKEWSFATKAGLIIVLFSLFVPFSYFLDSTKNEILLFGWGVTQTAIGTIGLLTLCFRTRLELLFFIPPILWLAFVMLLY